MPGIFGVVGGHDDVYAALFRSYRSVWGSLEERKLRGGRVAGHAFEANALVDSPDGSILARDGVKQAYVRPSDSRRDDPICGNLVRLFSGGALRLASSPAGAFPLHYVELPGGLAFSSRLQPLARAVSSSADPVGVATFLRLGHTFGGRTVFRNIWRLRPGEVVTYRPESGMESEDRSGAWATLAEDLRTPQEAAEAARDLLLRSLPTDGGQNGTILMTSAGWDSRTLLAGVAANGAESALRAYSHGDVGSRELRIARQLCESLGVTWRARAIGPEVWDPDHLDWLFSRVGTLVFPHWGWAGREAGGRCILSGVLGEVLGGHYGETQVAQGRAKVIALLKGVFPARGAGHNNDAALEDVAGVLSMGELRRPWYLAPGVEDDPARLGEAMNEDIQSHLMRLARRGVTSRQLLLEAFVTEHRGAQYICAQALSAQGEADVGLPFGEPHFFRFATSIPPHIKIHNRVNRALIRDLAPRLEKFPMAATLVPASWPLLLQEGSRVVRKVYEEGRWALHRWSRRRCPPPRLGWVDFGFLLEGECLTAVVDSLRADIWDHDALASVAAQSHDNVDARQAHPLFDQLGKILTVDRLLSGGGPGQV